MGGLYALMTGISTIVRQFVLPNPFSCFGDKGEVINWIAEPIIHALAYALVGLFYRKGDFPAFGSILYLISYASITGILALMGIFSFAWWWVLIVVVVIGFCVVKVGRWLSDEAW